MADENEDFEPEEEEELDDSDDTTDAVADADPDVDAETEEEEDEEAVAVPAARARKGEPVEVHSPAARAALRDTIAADVEAFLARGGSIEKIADDQRADPPKK